MYNMKVAIIFVLVAYCLFVQSAFLKRSRRQAECNEDDVPVQCNSLIDTTIDTAIFTNAEQFIADYCTEVCAQPLYAYFRACDLETGSSNSTKFDFACSSNSEGERCLTSVFEDLSFATACGADSFDQEICGEECKTALSTAASNLGCCAYTFLAVSAGPAAATALFTFCEGTPDLCIGGATDEPLQFIGGPVNVDPLCEDLVDDIPETCRFLLNGGNPEDIFAYVDTFCENDCAADIYQFNLNCDNRKGTSNSTLIDFICAENSAGERCGELLFSAYVESGGDILASCENVDDGCPSECTEELTTLQNSMGCCLITSIQLDSEEPGDVRNLFALCNVQPADYCVGAFSDEPIVPESPGGDVECISLVQNLPAACQQYANLQFLYTAAYVNPDTFIADFCDSTCGRRAYDYFVACDAITDDNEAAVVDFLCAQTDDGDDCARIYSDGTLETVFSSPCASISDTFCSDECSDVLQEPVKRWGCCLFTLTALDDNVTFIEGIVEQCRLPGNPHLCIGGFSDRPVAAEPGGETTCDRLRKKIPDDCNQVTFDTLGAFAYLNPEGYLSDFCKSDCATPVYEYLAQCDVQENAAYIDFFCTEGPNNRDCVNIISDSNLDATFEGVCADVNGEMCSSQCSAAIRRLSNDWGCCLYSFGALENNVTFVDDVYSECGVSSPSLCKGAISGDLIDAPGSENVIRDGAVSAVVSFTLLAIATITFVLVL